MILILLFFNFAFAQVGSTTDAMGGAGIAGAHAFESAIMNPASLIAIKSSYMGFQTTSGPAMRDVDLNQYTAFLTDAGEESLVPGNLFYRRKIYKVAGEKVREDQIQLTMAAALNNSLALGLSGYKIKTDIPTGQDYNQYNMDVGGYWLAQDYLSLGAVFHGVFGSKGVAWLPSQVLPSAGLGSEWRVLEMFRFRYDLNYFFEQNSLNRVEHHLGAEVRYENDLILRTGYSNDDRRFQNRWTAGAAWDGPRLKISYSYQKELRQRLGDFHTIDIWLDF